MHPRYSIGIDIVDISRFQALQKPAGVARFFLTETEWKQAQHSRNLAQYMASRFAAKEAVVKAVPEELRLLDFEVTHSDGAPCVRFLSSVPYQVSVSISHEKDCAVAVAMCTQ